MEISSFCHGAFDGEEKEVNTIQVSMAAAAAALALEVTLKGVFLCAILQDALAFLSWPSSQPVVVALCLVFPSLLSSNSGGWQHFAWLLLSPLVVMAALYLPLPLSSPSQSQLLFPLAACHSHHHGCQQQHVNFPEYSTWCGILCVYWVTQLSVYSSTSAILRP